MKQLRYVPLRRDQDLTVTNTVEVPVGARVVDVLVLLGELALLFELPTAYEGEEQREFAVICCHPGDGTTDLVSYNLPSDAQYIGTVGLHVGWLFCHVFEVEAL